MLSKPEWRRDYDWY